MHQTRAGIYQRRPIASAATPRRTTNDDREKSARAISRRTLCRSLLASWSLPLVVPLAACGGGAEFARPRIGRRRARCGAAAAAIRVAVGCRPEYGPRGHACHAGS